MAELCQDVDVLVHKATIREKDQSVRVRCTVYHQAGVWRIFVCVYLYVCMYVMSFVKLPNANADHLVCLCTWLSVPKGT